MDLVNFRKRRGRTPTYDNNYNIRTQKKPHLNSQRPVLCGLHAVAVLAAVVSHLAGVGDGLLGADGDGAEVVAELVLADPVVVGQLDDEVAVLWAVADLRVGIR